MKLRYLGTAAAEGIPGLFCNCKICQNALKVRGKEIKTRSQAIVDDTLLIDFPPDTYLHIINYGLDLRQVHHCIITHAHHDHLLAGDFWCRLEGIANDIGEEPLHVYLTAPGYQKAESALGKASHGARLQFHQIHAFEPFDAGEYHIIPLAANHDPTSEPVIFIIEHDDKTILYANDTGIFPECTWEYLEQYPKIFDLVSLDCTAMLLKGWRNSHMGLDTNTEVYERLCSMGRCTAETMAIINHFSHNGLATHEELVKAASEYGFAVSYDGLEIEV